MAGRVRRVFFRLVIAGALGAGAYFLWLTTVGSPTPVDLLPPGASGVVEIRDAEALAQRLSGTRFAAAFARSATRQWLERTDAVMAFDSVLAEVERISGVSPGRGSAFDLIGAEAAVGWYPPAGGGTGAMHWVAAGRLSWRAWAVATVMRLGRISGLGAAAVSREEIAGRAVFSLPASDGRSLHLFLAGRVLVGGSDRSLVSSAARAAGDAGFGVTREPAFLEVRAALPARGEILAWLRDGYSLPAAWPDGRTGRGSVGARVLAGKTIELDLVAQADAPRPAAAAGGKPGLLPGIALMRRSPLLLLASREPLPSALAEWLQTRREAVIRRNPGAPAPANAIQVGSGYAVVVTESSGGGGFFPVPRGLVVIGMPSAAEAARALPLLYPPTARTASGGGTPALATRESIPLAGEFDLGGAAVGPQLVFATDTALIAAVADDGGEAAASDPGDPPWPVSAVASVSVEKALPLLRRWSAPISGLLAAKWPDAPDIARDIDLLGAVSTMRAAAGSDGRFDRAAITLTVHDLR